MRRLPVIAIALLIVLVGVRVILPFALERSVNHVLSGLDGYTGSVGDVDVAIWRGAYELEDLTLQKSTVGKEPPQPFLRVGEVDLSIDWSRLFSGSLVGEAYLLEPSFFYTVSPEEAEKPVPEEPRVGPPWQQTVREFFPFTVDYIVVRKGTLRYQDPTTSPPVEAFISDIDGRIENVTNTRNLEDPLPTSVEFEALAMGKGDIDMTAGIDPFADRPTFDLNFRLEDLPLTTVNDLALAYAGMDFESGSFSMVVEAAVSKGKIDGYVKPLFRGVELVSLREDLGGEDKDLVKAFREALTGAASETLENQPRDQIATRVSLDGSLAETEVEVTEAIQNLLRNAFIKAFMPWYEHSIPNEDTGEGMGE